MKLDTPLGRVVGIGPRLSSTLERLNLRTVEDLIYHFPFRYDDFSQTATVSEVEPGQIVTIRGQLWSIKNNYTRSGKVLTRGLLNDGTNTIELVWFNQSWLTKSLVVGTTLQLAGKIDRQGSKLVMVMPKWEKVVNSPTHTPELVEGVHTGRLVPVYPETYGLTSKWIRQKIAIILPQVMDQIIDPLPVEIRGEMMELAQAISELHFPDDRAKLQRARQRLAFDELFYVQLATLKTRREWEEKEVIRALALELSDVDQFIDSLPFSLTKAQRRVIGEIVEDLKGDRPMNRLVQGEVGSGKTVVASAIAFLIAKAGMQTLVMAPTEILAFQHYETFSRVLNPLAVKTGIYTGSQKFANFKAGKPVEHPDVVIGTHALISKDFQVNQVGLVIIDEQQRFGVEQRAILRRYASIPHFLTMTATPIPRTVALTVYGDLDLSIIDQLPPGRQPVQTRYVPAVKREDAYGFIEQKVKEGDQVYLVTPLIEESETLQSAKAAKVEYERLQKIFPKLRLGLLHGRLKSKEKEAVINAFKEHKLDILVSTSVVEVGVDVANATIMVIEGAERFGLAALHQLRGRVGRGQKESWCFLFSESDDSQAVRKLKNLEKISDGLKLAELDLQMRGSGEVFGRRQSGRFDFKLASWSDLPLIERSRDAAEKILQDDPRLDKHAQLKVQLARIVADATPD